MSSFVKAIDHLSTAPLRQYGENNHSEYAWSEQQKDKIVQLYYQINRCSELESKKLASIMHSLLNDSKNDVDMTDILLRLIVFTRDLIDGKGERRISFDFVYELAKIYPEQAQKAIQYFVKDIPDKNNGTVHQYGSWRDLKLLWSDYDWKAIGVDSSFILKMWNEQLRDEDHSKLSLAAKWVPREKSKYKRMFYALAEDYYEDYLLTPKTSDKLRMAKNKAYTNYRKMISKMNVLLDTVQIKQCGQSYSDINYKHVTSITMEKQKNAFLNTDKNGKERSKKEDRIQGAVNLKKYISDKVERGETIQGKRVSIFDFVKDAMYYNVFSNADDVESHRAIINSQWEDAGKLLSNLDNYVAMVDTSGSMQDDNNIPHYNAIGLGCRIAEKSKLGRRVLTFNSQPSWVNLDNDKTLCDMVKTIDSSDSQGFGTNFTAALNLILDSVVKARLTNDVVKNIVLVILSDMQIEEQHNEKMSESMFSLIRDKYAEAGRLVHGIPYDMPNIMFWNLRTTKGFPVMTTQMGASMMSGSNPAIINSFCSSGLSELRTLTPWDNMLTLLNSDRYNIFSQ